MTGQRTTGDGMQLPKPCSSQGFCHALRDGLRLAFACAQSTLPDKGEWDGPVSVILLDVIPPGWAIQSWR